MSVLIRGMKMPESCGGCDLLCDYSDCMATGSTVWKYPYTGESFIDLEKERLPNCPLVEVKTPHGRLIDESSIKYDSEAVRCMDDGHILHELCVCKDVIEDLPTVMEPEE